MWGSIFVDSLSWYQKNTMCPISQNWRRYRGPWRMALPGRPLETHGTSHYCPQWWRLYYQNYHSSSLGSSKWQDGSHFDITSTGVHRATQSRKPFVCLVRPHMECGQLQGDGLLLHVAQTQNVDLNILSQTHLADDLQSFSPGGEQGVSHIAWPPRTGVIYRGNYPFQFWTYLCLYEQEWWHFF